MFEFLSSMSFMNFFVLSIISTIAVVNIAHWGFMFYQMKRGAVNFVNFWRHKDLRMRSIADTILWVCLVSVLVIIFK